MTTFQLVCALFFVGVVALVYGKQILARLTSAAKRVPGAPVSDTSIAVPLVEDIVAVTKLRDKLAAEGCKDGVVACTALLRVIVEYEQPSKGVV